MLLIATDEAGYGPKLGPLVIAATAWTIPADGLSHCEIDALFAGLRSPAMIGKLKIKVDDSKAVFKPGGGLAGLHAVVSASHHACGRGAKTLAEILPCIAGEDFNTVTSTPWLNEFGEQAFLPADQTESLIAAWHATGIGLVDVQARIITAAAFNVACTGGRNKADLLAGATLGLAKKLIDAHASGHREVVVYCDRFGGRRYYSDVLQETFGDVFPSVIAESSDRSAYRMTIDGRTIDVAFTVKGDRFTPVALSSMHAKYLRERMMESMNAHFQRLHRSDTPLRPTAGYPVDADRFLGDIEPILQREKIDRGTLVRDR
jgi:hypothetical protein